MVIAAAPAKSPRIEITNLVKRYRREGGASITPVNDISLEVAGDELVVLLGPSGCGKTTLLRCVAGLERPDEGEIVIDGKVVFSAKRGIYLPAEQRELSMVFQSYALWPHMTVAQNVAYPLQSRRAPAGDIGARVSKVLAMVGVAGLEQQYPSQISGGQQQRVALARALVSGSSVVLFDEPLSNVDAQVRAQLRFELQSMQRSLGFSGLYVTHDQTEAMELGHRVAVLDAGVVAALDTPRNVYNRPPSDYVARFVGVANIWPGAIAATGPQGATVEGAFGRVAVAPEGLANVEAANGRPVGVVTRPENLRLSHAASEEAGHSSLPARVVTQMFSGAHTEVVVELGGGVLATVWMQDQSRLEAFPAGAEAFVTIAHRQVVLVPGTAP